MTPSTILNALTTYCKRQPPICRKDGKCALEVRVEFLDGGQATMFFTHRYVKEKGAEEQVNRPQLSCHYKQLSTQDLRVFLDNYEGWHKGVVDA